MLENKIAPFILSLELLAGCVQKTYYIPSKSFYREGESFQQTCEISRNKLNIYLPDVCSISNVSEKSFTCNETTIRYDNILRLVLTDNDIDEDVLYISVGDEEYALAKKYAEKPLKEISDALNILKECGR